MKDELQDYMRRPKRYDNIDGTGEMLMGWMCLGFALQGYLIVALREHSMWKNGIVGLLLPFAVLLLVLRLGQWLHSAIKKHITWPRTGYVAYGLGRGVKGPWKGASAKVVLLAFAVLSAVIGFGSAYLLVVAKRHYAPTGLLTRAGFAAIFLPIYAFWTFHMGREHPWKWLVLAFMALGLLALALAVPGDLIHWWPPALLFVGLVWFLSGAATLVSYLRHTQRPAEETK